MKMRFTTLPIIKQTQFLIRNKKGSGKFQTICFNHAAQQLDTYSGSIQFHLKIAFLFAEFCGCDIVREH
jgi:hypothetical protein